MPISKRHHIVPQFYLERFCRPDPNHPKAPRMVWTYRRGEGAPRRQQPVNTAVRSHFNTFTDKTGRRTDQAERFLAQIDNEAAPVLGRVLAHPEQMTDDERVTLAVFFAVTLTRTAKHRSLAREIATAEHERRLRAFLDDESRVLPLLERYNLEKARALTLDDIREPWRKGGIKLTLTKQTEIAYALSLSLELADWFRGMSWALLEAPKGSEFVLSDYPVVIARPAPEVLRLRPDADMEITVPGDPERCFLLTPSGPYGLEYAPIAYVNEIVRRTVEQADREVYAARRNVIVARELS